jgi:hypothetical protein
LLTFYCFSAFIFAKAGLSFFKATLTENFTLHAQGFTDPLYPEFSSTISARELNFESDSKSELQLGKNSVYISPQRCHKKTHEAEPEKQFYKTFLIPPQLKTVSSLSLTRFFASSLAGKL